MSDVGRYPKEVFWSDEDDCYIAVARDLPGSSAFGETEQEALAELDKVIPVWIAVAHKAGNPVPSPSKPAEEAYSGKFVLRVPKSLHSQLARTAKAEGVSLNQHVLSLLSAASAVDMVERAARASTMAVIEAIGGTRVFGHKPVFKKTSGPQHGEGFAFVSHARWALSSMDTTAFSMPDTASPMMLLAGGDRHG